MSEFAPGVSVTAIVLAAGLGTRMRSEIPKPLHKIHGRELVNWVHGAVVPLSPEHLVTVVGHGRDTVEAAVRTGIALANEKLVFAHQEQQNGTGDAVKVALSALDDIKVPDTEELVLILPGDTPMITSRTLAALVAKHVETQAAACMLTANIANPTGYGRVIRTREGAVSAIVEHRDATEQQRQISEVNAGIYSFNWSMLKPVLETLNTDNDQGEYYLTDVIGELNTGGHTVVPFTADEVEILGVNDQRQLSQACAILRDRIVGQHLDNGVQIPDTATVNIDVGVEIEPGAIIKANTVLEGQTKIGAGAIIGPNSYVSDSQIGPGVRLAASSAVSSDIA